MDMWKPEVGFRSHLQPLFLPIDWSANPNQSLLLMLVLLASLLWLSPVSASWAGITDGAPHPPTHLAFDVGPGDSNPSPHTWAQVV